MTFEELRDKHYDIIDRLSKRRAAEATDLSIQYAIDLLEDIQRWLEMGSENYARLTAKITQLRNLIN